MMRGLAPVALAVMLPKVALVAALDGLAKIASLGTLNTSQRNWRF